MTKLIQISGAGNTFNLTLESEQTSVMTDRRLFVREVCKKTHTDGFIFLKWIDQNQNLLTWDFYNNDGSDAEMCGNATRCVGYYVNSILNHKAQRLKLKTIAGVIEIEVLSKNLFEVAMTAIVKFSHDQYFWCDTGVPHIVIEINNFENYFNLKEKCRELRFLKDFLPKGTNVTLVTFSTELNRLKAVSYERGVEDFTEACGTGAMAAAYYNLEKRGQLETFVEMPGGTLKMNLQDLKKPKMTGGANQIGEYDYEN